MMSTNEWRRVTRESQQRSDRRRRQERRGRQQRGLIILLLAVGLIGSWFLIALAVNAIANLIGGI